MSAPHLLTSDLAKPGATALRAFQDATGSADHCVISDLLTDLMHYCERFGIDFARELEHAQRFYQFEREGFSTDGGVQ
jgi:hypothetical protein